MFETHSQESEKWAGEKITYQKIVEQLTRQISEERVKQQQQPKGVHIPVEVVVPAEKNGAAVIKK